MNIIRFAPEHLRILSLQKEQGWMRELLDKPEYGPALFLAGPAFSAFEGDKLLGCGGVIQYAEHRAEVWALLSADIGPYMRPVTRAVRGWLSVAPYPRIEANVATHFVEGLRWIRLLGFEQEGPEMRKFSADGKSAYRFVRFKE